MADEKQEWIEVDVEALSRCLAKDQWKREVEDKVPETELYNLSTIRDPVTGQVEIIKEISDHFAGNFWALVDQYRELCLSFQKPTGYDDKSSKSQTGPEGIG